MGIKLHFSPVGNPAPPRPRRFEVLDFLDDSWGHRPAALCEAPDSRRLARTPRSSASPSARMFLVSGFSIVITCTLQDPVDPFRSQIEVQIVVDHHAGAWSHAPRHTIGSSVKRSSAVVSPSLMPSRSAAAALAVRPHDPATDAVAEHRSRDGPPAGERSGCRMWRRHPGPPTTSRAIRQCRGGFVGHPSAVTLHDLHGIDADGLPVGIVRDFGLDLLPLFSRQHLLFSSIHIRQHEIHGSQDRQQVGNHPAAEEQGSICI